MREFHRFQLWFLIPGILFTLICVLVPLVFLYQQLIWTQAEARIIDKIQKNPGPFMEPYIVFEYQDQTGSAHRFEFPKDNYYMEGKDDEHALILYNQNAPESSAVVNYSKYTLIIFLPITLLACYLGWPRKIEGPASNPYRSGIG